MTTLREDIQSLRDRLKEELGIEFDITFSAHQYDQEITKEMALIDGNILADAFDTVATVGQDKSGTCAWTTIEVGRAGEIRFNIFCDELAKEKEPPA